MNEQAERVIAAYKSAVQAVSGADYTAKLRILYERGWYYVNHPQWYGGKYIYATGKGKPCRRSQLEDWTARLQDRAYSEELRRRYDELNVPAR